MRFSFILLSLLILTNSGIAEQNRDQFFDSHRLYYVRVKDWDNRLLGSEALKKPQETPGSLVEIFPTDPRSDKHCPDDIAGDHNRLYYTGDFKLGMKGNATFGTPKASYKFKFKKFPFIGMTSLTLNSMWNDVSQMREALAWRIFKEMKIPASGHTYAKLCINGKYYGLYSIIEEIDREYVSRKFPNESKGNLYKANWVNEDIGPANLEKRSDGKYFRNPDPDVRTYELKAHDDHKKDKAFTNYSDIAKFIETLHKHDPKSDEFAAAMEEVMEVNDFLKWAAVNLLIGAWDNYWATPANYAIYNSGSMEKPYIRWLPWDYDHSFGITYGGSNVQYTDILNWSGLPLVKKLLRNPKFRGYYLHHIDTVLTRFMNEKWIQDEIGRLWPIVEKAAFLESDSPHGAPHTGRQWTNDQVYWNGREHHLLEKWQGIKIWGILHYTKMRHEAARKQLEELR